MGQQIGFFAIPEDFRAFLSFAELSGFHAVQDIILLGERAAGLVLPMQYKMKKNTGEFRFHLLPPGIPMNTLTYHALGDGTASRLMPMASPTIEVTPSLVLDGVIRNGRIYFAVPQAIAFHDEAKSGFRRVVAYIKGWEKADGYNYRIGPKTLIELNQGKIKLKEWF